MESTFSNGVPSGAILFAFMIFSEKLNKNENKTLLMHLKVIRKSIHHKWIKQIDYSSFERTSLKKQENGFYNEFL